MLLDSASLYFRAFYGVPDTVKAPDGTPVNAVRGFLDIITRLVTTYEPTHLVACWDDDWRPQWRVDLIPTYKTHRVAEVTAVGPDVEVVPDPLEIQVPIIRRTLDALGIPIVGAAEHEADDVIGTLATRASLPVDIVTGDRDLFQLIDDDRDVRVLYIARGVTKLEVMDAAALRARYGIAPAQYADFATLRGDPSDGLPGVPGIGEKTAASLLARFGTLDALLDAAASRDPPHAGVAGKLNAARDYLTVAPRVVGTVRTVPLPTVDTALPSRPPDAERLLELAERWGIVNVLGRSVKALGSPP
jgi:5'-3' exonuclease